MFPEKSSKSKNIENISKKSLPITAGGWIRNNNDINLLKNGADKVVINTVPSKIKN